MPATRKISQTAQDEDLAQMKNLFGGSSKKIETVAVPDFDTTQEENEIKQAFENNHHEAAQPEIITEEKKEVSDTTVGIRMTTAKKREMKAYFIQHGTTMSQGVIDAFSLLKMLEDEGVVAYKDGILERI